MPVSTETQVRVAHADVVMDMAFQRSLGYWQHGEKESDPWLKRTGDSGAIFLEEKQAVIIEETNVAIVLPAGRFNNSDNQ